MHYQESPHKCRTSIEVQICVCVSADTFLTQSVSACTYTVVAGLCVFLFGLCTRYRRLSSWQLYWMSDKSFICSISLQVSVCVCECVRVCVCVFCILATV